MIAAQHRILEVRKTPRKTDDSYRSTIAELPGLFTAGFTLSYLKGFLSTLATVELPPLLDNALLLAGLSFLILHLIANAQMLHHALANPLFLSDLHVSSSFRTTASQG